MREGVGWNGRKEFPPIRGGALGYVARVELEPQIARKM